MHVVGGMNLVRPYFRASLLIRGQEILISLRVLRKKYMQAETCVWKSWARARYRDDNEGDVGEML